MRPMWRLSALDLIALIATTSHNRNTSGFTPPSNSPAGILSIPYPFVRSLESGVMGAATEPILLIMEGAMLPDSLAVKLGMDLAIR